jgi:protein-S-isoprenylcysteine O-methyltransferase Ste14
LNVHPLHLFLVRKRTTFTWLVPLTLFIASWFFGHRNVVVYLVGLTITIIGEAVRVWAAGMIHKDDTIAETGPYGLVRNPLYLGSLLIAIGAAVMSCVGWIAWVVILALFLLFHMAAILYEEQFLKQKFGAPYERYLERVPRLIPRPGKSVAIQSELRFSWEQVKYNREPTTALITVASAIAYGLLVVFK